MKKLIAFTVWAVCLTLLSSCGDASKEHLQDASQNLKEAGGELTEAAKDANEEAKRKATTDWQNFKSESDSTMAAMDKQVTELKERIAKANSTQKAKLTSELSKLEQNLNAQKAKLDQKNAEFEADMKSFTETVATRQESFKREFKHDNEELGTAIKNLFKDNVE